jgi:hypothetical protein
VDYLKERLHKTQTVEIIDNAPFIKDLFKKMNIIDPKSLKFASTRHKSLLQTLEVVDVDTYAPLSTVADLCQIAATYSAVYTDVYVCMCIRMLIICRCIHTYVC